MPWKWSYKSKSKLEPEPNTELYRAVWKAYVSLTTRAIGVRTTMDTRDLIGDPTELMNAMYTAYNDTRNALIASDYSHTKLNHTLYAILHDLRMFLTPNRTGVVMVTPKFTKSFISCRESILKHVERLEQDFLQTT